MSNSRFREIAPGVTAELIATSIRLDYAPNGLETPEALTATWWGQEFIPIGGGHELIGDRGDRMETRLSDWATTTRTIWDPVLQQHVTLSAMGWVEWGKSFYDHAHNAQNPPPAEQPEDPEE